ncbi:MAG: type II toxin-antitoxin system VapC family toxin [Usitatibacter sp.]
MVYVDTSALVPMFIREASSEAIVDWLESSAAPLAISNWSLVEFASALAMKSRMGHTPPTLAERAAARLRAFTLEHCTVVTPRAQEFRRAAELVFGAAMGLRAGDALHLAIAEAVDAREILCLDQEMCDAARGIGMSVVTIE